MNRQEPLNLYTRFLKNQETYNVQLSLSPVLLSFADALTPDHSFLGLVAPSPLPPLPFSVILRATIAFFSSLESCLVLAMLFAYECHALAEVVSHLLCHFMFLPDLSQSFLVLVECPLIIRLANLLVIFPLLQFDFDVFDIAHG